jgi:hypothetical protein
VTGENSGGGQGMLDVGSMDIWRSSIADEMPMEGSALSAPGAAADEGTNGMDI